MSCLFFQQEYRFKVLLSTMHEIKSHDSILQIWIKIFCSEMINVQNCLDIILFLGDCKKSVKFIRELKKISSQYLVQYWPQVRSSPRWTDIRNKPDSLVKIYKIVRKSFKNLATLPNFKNLNFTFENLQHREAMTSDQMIDLFFDKDLIALHKFWVQARFDFRIGQEEISYQHCGILNFKPRINEPTICCEVMTPPSLCLSFAQISFIFIAIFATIFVWVLFSYNPSLKPETKLESDRSVKYIFPEPVQLCMLVQ